MLSTETKQNRKLAFLRNLVISDNNIINAFPTISTHTHKLQTNILHMFGGYFIISLISDLSLLSGHKSRLVQASSN